METKFYKDQAQIYCVTGAAPFPWRDMADSFGFEYFESGPLDAPAAVPTGGSRMVGPHEFTWEVRGARSVSMPETAVPGANRKAGGRRAVHVSAAARQAAYRARKGQSITVIVPPDLADAFAKYMVRQSMDGAALTQSQVICNLLRSQLLRKR